MSEELQLKIEEFLLKNGSKGKVSELVPLTAVSYTHLTLPTKA